MPALKCGPDNSGGSYQFVCKNESRMRVFLTKFGEHWNKKPKNDISKPNSNQIFKVTNAYINLPIDHNYYRCRWQTVERHFTIPSDHDKLTTLVLLSQANAYAIDDVVIFKKCPQNMVIQNKTYDGYFYDSADQGDYEFYSGYTFTNEATSTITTSGSVTVEDEADIIGKEHRKL